MHAGNTTLYAVNVHAALGQLDLLPSQVAHFRGPQPVAVGDQDHGCVAMAVAAMLSGAAHQPLDLALGEVAPLDCQVYDAWGAFPGSRFHADKPCLRVFYCAGYTTFLNSVLVRTSCVPTKHGAIQGLMLGRPSAVENQTGEFRQVVGAVERRLPMGALLNSIADPWRPPPTPPFWILRIAFNPSPK